ncbi:33910_t:CDS:1, partial [Gigaspora margarita]
FSLIILSGSQTGVDQGALNTILEYICAVLAYKNNFKIIVTSWCPLGRQAKDSKIPLYYPLTETKTSDYKERTELNVRDAYATLILTFSDFDSKKDGTNYTIDKTNELNNN